MMGDTKNDVKKVNRRESCSIFPYEGEEKREGPFCLMHAEQVEAVKEQRQDQKIFHQQFLQMVQDIHNRINDHSIGINKKVNDLSDTVHRRVNKLSTRINIIWGGIIMAGFAITLATGYVGFNIKRDNAIMTAAIEKVEEQGKTLAGMMKRNEVRGPVTDKSIDEIKTDIKSLENKVESLDHFIRGSNSENQYTPQNRP